MSKYRTAAEIGLVLALMVSLGVNISDNDQGYIPYSCDLEDVDDMMCYKLSRVGTSGVQRNCYYDRDNSRKYKVCSAGWERIEEIQEPDCPSVTVIAYTDNGKYFCEGTDEGAICVNEQFDQVPYNTLG